MDKQAQIDTIKAKKKALQIVGQQLYESKKQAEQEYHKAVEKWQRIKKQYEKLDYQEKLLTNKTQIIKKTKDVKITESPEDLAEKILKNLTPAQRIGAIASILSRFGASPQLILIKIVAGPAPQQIFFQN